MPILLTPCPIYARRWPGYRHENAGRSAHQVLEHYQLAQLPVSALQMPLHCPPQAIAHHQQLEQQALGSLQHWGVFPMSELNDLLTTRELQRWRLILGEAAETTLCGLDGNARQMRSRAGVAVWARS